MTFARASILRTFNEGLRLCLFFPASVALAVLEVGTPFIGEVALSLRAKRHGWLCTILQKTCPWIPGNKGKISKSRIGDSIFLSQNFVFLPENVRLYLLILEGGDKLNS